ncbi:MAG: DUF456 domain-containing protein [Pirellulaceae bacterium]|nr:DUF456 domain-containing protein [Planctomycetales bacterium]
MLSTTWVVLLIVALLTVLIASWILTLLGIPGNWIMIAAVVAYDVLLPTNSACHIGWLWVGALVLLALLGEFLEFIAGAAGVAKVGGTRLSACLALVGSMIGGIVGVIFPLGWLLPVIGQVLGVLFFASAGALVGAMLGEDWHGRDLNDSFRVGMAAFWGRLLGSIAKSLVGGVMVAVTTAGVFL